MRIESKICLPFYKIAYAVFFTGVLCLIRGVTYTQEIGPALESPMVLLAAVFCADTYIQEILSGRYQIQRLYPLKNRLASMAKRLMIQEAFLLFLSAAGYGMYLLVQRPVLLNGEERGENSSVVIFLIYLGAVFVSLLFWGLLSHVLSCLFRNMWAGIGSCLLLWTVTNSTVGDKWLGCWNLFSYSFRDLEDSGDLSWLWGKLLCVAASILLAYMLPKIVKKRG